MAITLYSTWIIISTLISLYMGISGYKKKSLSKSGAISAIIVGFLTFSLNSIVGIVLIAFFLSSSKLTKYGAEKKKKIEYNYQVGGQRTLIQVLSNSFSATLLLIAIVIAGYWMATKVNKGNDVNILQTFLSSLPSPSVIPFSPLPSSSSPQLDLFITSCIIGAIAHYACCCSDTWSSEIGSLAKQPPILITTFKSVPAGTNGGCSLSGLLAGIAGGTFIGIIASIVVVIEYFAFFSPSPSSTSSTTITDTTPLIEQGVFTTAILFNIIIRLITIGFTTGLIGTLLDSVLGAFLQCSVFDNDIKMVIEIESWKEYDEKIGENAKIVSKSTPPVSDKKNNKNQDNVSALARRNQPAQQNDVKDAQTQRYEHICGYPLLDNHQVNLLSSTIIGIATFGYMLLF